MKIIIFLFGTVIFLATTANAQQIDGGVFSRLRCIVGPECIPGGNILEDETPGDGLAQTQMLDVAGTQIAAAASVGFDGPALTPNISAYAYIPAGTSVFTAVHWGFQRYTLNGNQARVNAILSFSRSAQGDPTFSRAAIIAFRMQDDIFDLQGCPSTLGYNVLFCLRPDFTFLSMAGLLTYQEAQFEEFAAPGPAVVRGNSHASLTISGSPGDEWFVGSYLHYRNASGGTFFDSRNTLTMEFEDDASVVPSLASVLPPGGTAVPAPAPGSPTDLLDDLMLKITDVNVQKGISNALDAKTQTIERVINDLNQQNNVAAINSLTAFTYFVQAQRGNQIDEADADMLIAAALAVISSIGG